MEEVEEEAEPRWMLWSRFEEDADPLLVSGLEDRLSRLPVLGWCLNFSCSGLGGESPARASVFTSGELCNPGSEGHFLAGGDPGGVSFLRVAGGDAGGLSFFPRRGDPGGVRA